MLRKTYVHRGPLHFETTGISFGLFSADEVRDLSVVKVITPISFNALNHPLPGGLYDPRMGPFDQGGMCGTCQQTIMYCPGHFGHIELPLPVINPLFSKTILQIFRLSCLGCHSITIPPRVKHLSVAQLKLLGKGMLKEAQEADDVLAGIIGADDSMKKGRAAFDESDELGARFEEYLHEFMGTANKEDRPVASTRNTENMRMSVLKRVGKMAKMNKKCPLCGMVCKKMMLFESKIVYTLHDGSRVRTEGDERPGPSYGGEEDEDEDRMMNKQGSSKSATAPSQKYLTPLEARDHLRMLWLKDSEFLAATFPVLQSSKLASPTDVLFVEVVPVPPPKNRPAQMVANRPTEHPQNLCLRFVMQTSSIMNYTLQAIRRGIDTLSPEAMRAIKEISGTDLNDKLEAIWKELQVDVDHVMDRDKGKLSNAQAVAQIMGLKQIIEKKDGLFRMHMMGKRVNFAARTVITPDPNIHIEEIGIPDVFAKVLTFPTPVTFWNVNMLRKMVINGPDVHPGAVSVENELGQVSRLDGKNLSQREGIARRLLVSDKLSASSFKGIKTVHRHLQNGDMLLLNRQPSLHRPSIMAHRARVLHGEKVFRLHYANCKHYNADFDGDEMNAHFPQNSLGRSEASNLVNVCSHFLTPKDGTPLGGLIQDHVVAAVKLTVRGRFFTQADYHQLVYFALNDYTKLFTTEPPTILKPEALWSGKQVISTIIKNLVPYGRIPPTFTSSAKIKSDEWRQYPERHWKAGGKLKSDDMSESAVIFRKGQLLSGILDKVHLGATPYGLCHVFFELYGNAAVGSLLSAFSRLMTNFLQWEGFTLGVKDVLVKTRADAERAGLMEEAKGIGHSAASYGVGATPDIEPELLTEKLEQVHRSGDPKLRAMLDQSYKYVLDTCNNNINRACLPHGLVSIFPQNNLQLLVQSGAKGSTVNTMQMSCLLGQIELEGKRPPLTISGRSLPSFKPYDTSARAGGFISARFLTGIRPQEFFFHCMAGREGLIDTAVKTSRSGYLQRCLVKLLEGVTTQYDGTVRDSDGSVIQFLYGEDGLDVCKSQFLKPKMMGFLDENAEGVLDPEDLPKIESLGPFRKIEDYKCERVEGWRRTNRGLPRGYRQSGFLRFYSDLRMMDINTFDPFLINPATGRTARTEELQKRWYKLPDAFKKKYKEMFERCPDPVVSIWRPDANYSSVSETLEATLNDHISKGGYSRRFSSLVYYKAMRAQSSPGDAVGVLAAQSIGEPSTQMTLNTFHFAGRGEMNVTLGIPRLREILMVASEKIRTPSMDIPFLPTVTEEEAEGLRLRLTRATLSQVLQQVQVTERIALTSQDRVYTLKFTFLAEEEYEDRFWIKPSHILRYFEKVFLRHRLLPAIRKVTKTKRGPAVGASSKKKGRGASKPEEDIIAGGDEDEAPPKQNNFEENERRGGGEGHVSSDDEPEGDDEDATQAARRARQAEREYDAPEEEERLPDPEEEHEDLGEDPPMNAEPNENESDGEEDEAQFRVSQTTHESRVGSVIEQDDYITAYEFDRIREEHCTVTLKLPLSTDKMNMNSLLKEECEKGVIHQIANINRAFVNADGEKLSLKTEGINILAMALYPNLLDLSKLYCNNVHTMAKHYGIEAASKVIVKEMSDVFKAYGITVDPRHLTLIADYMTFIGAYRPFNRIGIESSSSPLQQMSFETVVTFLKDATLSGRRDELTNPSARLIMGKPAKVGTGIFDLIQKL